MNSRGFFVKVAEILRFSQHSMRIRQNRFMGETNR